jgi:hypothetical protein
LIRGVIGVANDFADERANAACRAIEREEALTDPDLQPRCEIAGEGITGMRSGISPARSVREVVQIRENDEEGLVSVIRLSVRREASCGESVLSNSHGDQILSKWRYSLQ